MCISLVLTIAGLYRVSTFISGSRVTIGGHVGLPVGTLIADECRFTLIWTTLALNSKLEMLLIQQITFSVV